MISCVIQNGLTALMKATDRGHKDVVESLLAGNANPNIIDKVTCHQLVFVSFGEGAGRDPGVS